MEDRSFYVYAHYRLDTMEPFYIGKGKGKRKDILSRNTIHDNISKKHGHAVVVLFDNLTEEEAFFYEQEIIEYLVFNEGYEIPCKNCGEFTRKFSYLTNFTFGGEGTSGCNPFVNKTEEEMKEIKEKKGKSMKMHYEDPEARKKQSKSIKKRFEDPNEIEKLSKSQKKRYENEKEREKRSKTSKKLWEDPKKRKKLSESQKKSWEDPKKRKMQSETHSGKNNAMYGKNPEDYMTPEAIAIKRKKTSEKLSGELNPNAISVYCNELNIIFSYIGLAEKYCKNVLNIKIGPIRYVCNSKRKSAGKLVDGTKLTWKWIEDVNQETLDNAIYIDSEKYEEIIQAKLSENKKIS